MHVYEVDVGEGALASVVVNPGGQMFVVGGSYELSEGDELQQLTLTEFLDLAADDPTLSQSTREVWELILSDAAHV